VCFIVRKTISELECTILTILFLPVQKTPIMFFYPGESSTRTRAPHMLDSLPSRSWEIIHTNIKQTTSLTLKILKSQYQRVDLDMVGEGIKVTYSDEEALKLVEDSAMMVGDIVDMLPVGMSLG
jgi:hypothetical protein